MRVKFNPRYPVKILAWYKKDFFFIFHRKMVDNKALKLAENGKIQYSNNFRFINDRHLIFSQ